jgi:hypothetical protein
MNELGLILLKTKRDYITEFLKSLIEDIVFFVVWPIS